MDDLESPTARIFTEYFMKKSDFEVQLDASYRLFSTSILKSYQAEVEEMKKSCQDAIRKGAEEADLHVLQVQNSVENDTKQIRTTHESNERRGKLITNLLKYLSKKVACF